MVLAMRRAQESYKQPAAWTMARSVFDVLCKEERGIVRNMACVRRTMGESRDTLGNERERNEGGGQFHDPGCRPAEINLRRKCTRSQDTRMGWDKIEKHYLLSLASVYLKVETWSML